MKPDDLKKLDVGTRLIKAANQADFRQVNSHIPPIFQTVNYDYPDVDEGMQVFAKNREGYFYTREGNPTMDLFASMVALIEDGEQALSTASGMAAISNAILSFVEPGDEILSSAAIYGGTKAWLDKRLRGLQVNTAFVDITDLAEVKAAVSSRTRILYTEVIGNPNLVLADISGLAEIAEQNNLLLVVDSTFSPPPICQPLNLGADLVIQSATKYIGGHGDIMAGVIIGDREKIEPIRETVKLYGGIVSPFNAWLAIRGLKTLKIRLEKHCENAQAIAEFLYNHPKVERVLYPGLPSHSQHDLAKRQLNGFGGMLAFEVKGGLKAGKTIMNSVQVCNFTVSLGEIDTLIMHPATTSHQSLTPEERQAIGITDGLMRLSVGIEDTQDLINDLKQALNNI
ncbi:MAG: aminotransferase class I/II-fold pyridoxal phosphate-dependent enzyme [candidate division KSB1 bacterium]|nr:aminotransferase class I/II-fold pyridoxal phosphate-dependent enzyme [candidate division KSB1 bacterium]